MVYLKPGAQVESNWSLVFIFLGFLTSIFLIFNCNFGGATVDN